MLPAAPAAFVAGVFLLQQQAALPSMLALNAMALVATAFGALALRARWTQRQRAAVARRLAAAVLVTSACAAAFAYAGWCAQLRLDVAL